MSTESQVQTDSDRLATYFATESMRTGDHAISAWLPGRAGFLDDSGRLRLGPIAYTVDIAAGMAMGLAVIDDDRWVVTTDIDVRMTGSLSAGPLRVDAEVVRAGATTAVAAFRMYDEGSGRCVGGGTCTGRPFPVAFDRSLLEAPLGERIARSTGPMIGPESMSEQLGLEFAPDGSVQLEVADWLRNPWGIMHGGVTACLVDVAAERATADILAGAPRPAGATIRYLAPGRSGPLRAAPQVVCAGAGEALVEVRVTDQGVDDRLVAVASVTVTC